MRTSIWLLTGIVASAGLAGRGLAIQQVDRSDALLSRLETLVDEARGSLGLDGLCLTALVGGQELISTGYGEFNGRPAKPDALLPAGATLELLVMTGALQLASKQGLALDTKLGTLLPERDLPFGDVTLIQLLTHTSGLALVPDDLAVEAAVSKTEAPEEGQEDKPVDEPWLTWLRQATHRADANTCVQWSNADVLLLELWLRDQDALGQVGEYEAALKPAQTAKWLPIVREQGLGRLESGVLPARLAGPQAVLSNQDVAQLLKRLLKEDRLGSETSAQLMQEVLLEDGEPSGRSVGFAVTSLGDYAGFSFGGAVGENTVHGAYYPELDLILTLSGQGASTSLVALERSLSRALFDLEQPELSDLPLSEDELAQLVGTYKIGCDTLELSVSDGRLVLHSTALNVTFAYQGGGSFHALGSVEVELDFRDRKAGPAESFVLSAEGQQAIARRFQ